MRRGASNVCRDQQAAVKARRLDFWKRLALVAVASAAVASAVETAAATTATVATATAAVSAATATATAAAKSTAATTAATTRATVFTRTGFVDGQGTAIVLLPVEGGNCGRSLGVVGHFHESKTLATPRVPVVDDLGTDHLPMRTEQLLQCRTIDRITEVTDVQLLTHCRISRCWVIHGPLKCGSFRAWTKEVDKPTDAGLN